MMRLIRRRLWFSVTAAAALCCCWLIVAVAASMPMVIIDEFRSYDGRNNNAEHPEWGSTNTPRIRHLPASAHPDWSNTQHSSDLPSARRVMEELFRQARPGKDKTVSHVLLELGHFIVQDLLGSSENATDPMPVPCDGTITDYVFCPVTKKHYEISNDTYSMPFFRQTHTITTTNASRSSSSGSTTTRNTINGMTAFLDLSNLYGLHPESSQKMQSSRGRLHLDEDNLPPQDASLLPEGMKNGMNTSPGAFCFYVLFMRYHNHVADRLYYAQNTSLTDDRIFELARQQTIAVYQNLVEEGYLPTLLGDKLDDYKGYSSQVNPSIDEFFAAVGFRYAHTNFAQAIRVLDRDSQPTPEDPLFLRDVFKKDVPTLVRRLGGIEPFLRGLAVTPSKAMDASFVDDLNLYSEATSVLDVQRGRDVGVPPYNDAREKMGLGRMGSLEELAGENNTIVLAALRTLYHGDIGLVDAYVGAVLEKPDSPLDQMGPMLTTSLKDQFTRLRDGDRFWYKNIYNKEEYEAFPSLSELVKLLCDGMESFPDDPFLLAASSTNDSSECQATTANNNQISFLNGEFVLQWRIDQPTTSTSDEGTIDVTLKVMEEMQGSGYIGVGWGSKEMKGADIWFCTVDFDKLQANGGLAERCSPPGDEGVVGKERGVVSCCLAPGEKHDAPECLEPGDDRHYYPLEVVDWCLSQEQSSVTIRALTCPANNRKSNSTTNQDVSGCFGLDSTADGETDVIVAYNPLSLSRPHGYQRRTAVRIDLRAGLLTETEAHTADTGLMATHGAFMLVGWVVLAPIGVFVVRYMKTKSWRLVAHISIMLFVGSLMLPLLVGVLASVGETDKTQDHSLVGLIVVGIFFLMALTGRYRFVKWQGQKIGRKIDFITLAIHKLGGITFIALAWWNCYTGLVRISPEDSSYEPSGTRSQSMGYDVEIFGFIKNYLYGPWIAFVALVFLVAEVRKLSSGSAQAKMKDGGSLWDDDGAGLDSMTLAAFLDATKLGNCLCIVDGRILDITDFASSHPGGPEMLRYVRGSDITQEFLGQRDVDGFRHVHSQTALKLLSAFVVAKLVTDDEVKGMPTKGRKGLLPALMKSKFGDLQMSTVFNNLPSPSSYRRQALPFRRAKVIDVQYLAPSWLAPDQRKPVILLRLSMARNGEADKEDKVTKLPGCSFRFRGIDKKGIMFEREYTAVRIAKQTKAKLSRSRQQQYMSLANMDAATNAVTPASMFLSRMGTIFDGETDEECYDFVISLIPGGQMSNFLLGLKCGKLLLAQGPKVSPPVVSVFSDPKWKSVMFLAGGTGIAPMLQVIDFYLEKKHRDEIPLMFLVWVIRSPYHSFQETLGLTHRVKASAGRLKVITVFSTCGETDSSSNPSSNSNTVKRSEDWSRRTTKVKASQTGRPGGWMRASLDDWSSRQDHSRQDHRKSTANAPNRGLLGGFLGGKKKAKVKDLIRCAQLSTEHSETLAPTEDSDRSYVFDSDFWARPVRSMNRHIDQLFLHGLLSAAREYSENHQTSSSLFAARDMAPLLDPLTQGSEQGADKATDISDGSFADDTGSAAKDIDAASITAAESEEAEAAESEEAEEDEEAGDTLGDLPNAFEGMLVALSGSPAFDTKVSSILGRAGLPRKQMVTFGISTQQV